MSTDITAAETVTNPVTIASVHETSTANSRLLFQVQVNSCSGAASMIVRRLENQNGFEAWTQLRTRYRSTSGQSAQLGLFGLLVDDYERAAHPEVDVDDLQIPSRNLRSEETDGHGGPSPRQIDAEKQGAKQRQRQGQHTKQGQKAKARVRTRHKPKARVNTRVVANSLQTCHPARKLTLRTVDVLSAPTGRTLSVCCQLVSC